MEHALLDRSKQGMFRVASSLQFAGSCLANFTAVPLNLRCNHGRRPEQGADWLYTAKNTEKEIDRILSDYYEGNPARGKSPRRPDPRTILDRVGLVVDARRKHLRRQEDDLRSLINAIRKWDDKTRSFQPQV